MKDQSVLIIGSGGRAHALAWKLAHSLQVKQVYVAPGNAGTTWPSTNIVAPAENVALSATDIEGLVNFAQEKNIDLTVVGPEAPLVAGLADAFHAQGLPVFGPVQAAAQLEGSKAFAKEFMQANHIPTADYAVFEDYQAADHFLETAAAPWLASNQVVVKADGLAGGKGVMVCDSLKQARAALTHMMQENAFGSAGNKVVIERRLHGKEVSIFGLSDGKTVWPFISARDHKRAYDGDKGPNTGGMGAFAPTPTVDKNLVAHITETVLQTTVTALRTAGTPYVGVLYAGVMLTETDGPMVLEFNCRFGDPEIQAIIPLLQTDLYPILKACVEGRLRRPSLSWSHHTCATIVMASPGYPGSYYPTGLPISGLDEAASAEQTFIYHAGTAQSENGPVTAGGRVLNVTAWGNDLDEALEKAYAAVDKIHFEGAQFRRDIGRSTSE